MGSKNSKRKVKSKVDLKVGIFGNGGVGKTSFCIRYVQSDFIPDLDPTVTVVTIEDYIRQHVVDGDVALIEILDVGSFGYQKAQKDQCIRDSLGIILAYDVTNRESFESLRNARDSISGLRGDLPPIVVIGCKSDLSDTKRVVTVVEGTELAMSWGAPFFETSAKDGNGVVDAMEALVRLLRNNTGKEAKHVSVGK